MRLTDTQRQTICASVSELVGSAAKIYVYGSRTDDTRHGGDVDLLILHDPKLTLLQRAQIKTTLECRLNLPFDILSDGTATPHRPFVALALAQAQPISVR